MRSIKLEKRRTWRRKRVCSYKPSFHYGRLAGMGIAVVGSLWFCRANPQRAIPLIPMISKGQNYRVEWFVPKDSDVEGDLQVYGIRYVPGEGLQLYRSSQRQISGH